MLTGLGAAVALAALFVSRASTPSFPSSVPNLTNHYWAFHFDGGQTLVPLFGDTDRRTNFLAGLDYVISERFLRMRRRRGSLVQEIYLEDSQSKRGSRVNANLPSQYVAFGYLAGARYDWVLGRYDLYADLGIGIQFNNRRTIDLPSAVNTTPFLDVGLTIPGRRRAFLLGIRFLHSSDADTTPGNFGQNQLFFEIGEKL